MASSYKPSHRGRGVRYILHAFGQHRAFLLFATLASWVAVAAELIIPLLTKDAVDIATGQQPPADWTARLFPDVEPVTALVIVLILTALVRLIFHIGRRYTSTALSVSVQHTLRVDLLRALHYLDGQGYRSIEPGQVISRSISDLNAVQRLLAMYARGLSHLTKFVGIVVIMLWAQPLLATLALLFLPLSTYLTWKSRSSMYAANWSAQQIAGDLAEHVTETVTGIRVVKAFTQEDREITRLDSTSRRLFAHRMRSARVTARYQPLVDQIPQIALVANIVVGGLLALHGHITVGLFFAFSTYLTQLSVVSRGLSLLVMRYQLAAASIDRIGEILDIPTRTPAPQQAASLPDGPLGLGISDLSYSVQGRTILDHLSLRVEAGQTVGIVGPPGAGKSLLVQLIGKFSTPNSGHIELIATPSNADGDASPLSETRIDLATLDTATLSTVVCLVFDEPFLYSASIRDNITMGQTYSEAEILEAIEDAEAREFIDRLPEGLDTPIGEKGLTLSGGQRQRIALARALVRRPRILVLDDATSAIDAVTEARIISHLKDRLQDVTVVAITHRPSLLRLVDRQIRLEHGQAVELRSEASVLQEAPQTSRQAGSSGSPALSPGKPGVTPRTTTHSSLSGDTVNPALSRALAELPEATDEPSLQLTETLSLSGMLRAVKGLIAGVIVLLVIGVGADLAFPTLMRWAIDGGVVKGQEQTLWIIAAVATGVVLIAWATAYLKSLWTVRTGEEVLYGLRVRSYSHLLKLSMDYFESTMVGKILTRMTTDIDALSAFLQTGLAQTIVSLTTLVGITVMLLVTNLTLASIALLSLPIIVVATLIFRAVSSRLYRAAREQISEVNAIFAEALAGLPTAQIYGTTHITEHKLEIASARYKHLRDQGILATAIYFPTLHAISSITQALLLGVGVHYANTGEISIGVVVAFIMYMGNLFAPIQELGEVFDSWQQASVGLRRISDLLNQRSTVPNTPDSATSLAQDLSTPDTNTPHTQDCLAAQAAGGVLGLENVSFGYSPLPEATTVTEHLSLKLRPGETVALVGPTGTGKSTILKLLARFYDPLSGAVTASGVNITRFDLHSWRRAVGLVPQEPYLFQGTVADNIAYGVPEATSQEINRALAAVGATDILTMLPEGLNTPVKILSSGQRQLVALARAELKNPPLMLLDEATAALDMATEQQVLNAAQALTSRRTSVIVAHRLATAQRADRIFVIDNGHIRESGTHRELLEKGGSYRRLWDAATRGGTTGGLLRSES